MFFKDDHLKCSRICLKAQHNSLQMHQKSLSIRAGVIKVIRFDPLAPVKTTAKMPDLISNNEYLELICKKKETTRKQLNLMIKKAFRNNDFG